MRFRYSVKGSAFTSGCHSLDTNCGSRDCYSATLRGHLFTTTDSLPQCCHGEKFAVLRLVRATERVTIHDVDVSAADVAKVPAGNMRVSRAEFVALWQTAERFHDEQVRRGVADWYGSDVVETCRWLANAIVKPEVGPWRLASSPVTKRIQVASNELIEAECRAAEQLAGRRPVPA
jgi:hypothetical protein